VVPTLDIRVTIRIFDGGSVCINGVPDLDIAYFIATSFLNTLYAYLVLNLPLPKDRSARVNFVPPPPIQDDDLAILGDVQEDEFPEKAPKRPRKKRAVSKAEKEEPRHSILDVFRLGDGKGPLNNDDPDAIAALLAQVDDTYGDGFFDS
jgi:hypothetical protein